MEILEIFRWVGAGCGVLALGVSVFILVKFMGYLSDMKRVMNTGRGWEKRLGVCRDMFLRRVLHG